MSRMTLLFLALATIAGIVTFGTKQRVATLEAKLSQTTRGIQSLQESMHVLSAEWNYLNNPVRLQALAEKHLGLIPGSSHHLVRYQKRSQDSLKSSYDTDAMMRLAGQLGD